MKAAFLFSGQLRGFKYCIDSLKTELFDLFDVSDKFFFCTTEDYNEIDLLKSLNPINLTFEQDFYHPLDEVVNSYNQITYSNSKIAQNGYSLKGRMQHYYLQWYGVKRVFEIMENYSLTSKKQYDLIFRLRFDTFMKTSLNINEVKLNCLNVPDFDHWGGIHDRFGFGSMDTMKVYCHQYDNFHLNNIGNSNSEGRLLQYLTNNKIDINKINFSYDRLNKDGSIQP